MISSTKILEIGPKFLRITNFLLQVIDGFHLKGSFGTFHSTSVILFTFAVLTAYMGVLRELLEIRKALKLFQTYVEPILLYNAENFTMMTTKQIEKYRNGHLNIHELATSANITTTQLKFIKFILGVGKSSPNMAVLGEAATIPLHMRAQIAMLKFWNRIRYMGEDTLVKLAYKENVENNTTWCKSIQVLNTAYQLNTRNWTELEFPDEMKKELNKAFINHWRARIDDRGCEKKLHLYAQVKKEFKIGKYLDIPSFRERQIISKLLCSSHTLRIETGRHQNIPRDERTCQLCDNNKTEDEDHFIMECPSYNQIRRESPIQFENYANVEALFHLEEPLDVAEFLRKAYTHRDQLMTPETYRVKERSEDGLKLLLRKGKDTPGQYKAKNITKDGLRLKIIKI